MNAPSPPPSLYLEPVETSPTPSCPQLASLEKTYLWAASMLMVTGTDVTVYHIM